MRNEDKFVALEEAASLLLTVKIQYETRGEENLSVPEREVLASIRQFLTQWPPPGGDV